MKHQYRPLFFFLALLLAVSLGCVCNATDLSTPTPAPVSPANNDPTPLPPLPTKEQPVAPPTTAPQPVDTAAPAPQQGSSSDIVTFTDGNNLLAFDLPGDWTYEHTDLGDQVYSDAQAYSDTFTSPDGSALIESLVIFSQESLDKSTSAAAALDLLHRFYSNTGQVGDIRISSDQIMQDGSERFEWESKGGNYSGLTFFEVRGNDRRTWLMWTLWYDNYADQEMLDALDAAINSYYIP